MLTLTKKTHYALIALSLLAKRSGGVISARQIAETSGLPLPILTNVLKTLANAGIVSSTRGATGGYEPAKPMEAISLHELITTIEGPFHFVQCATSETQIEKGSCEHESSCPIRRPAYRIHDRLKAFLKSVSLSEIISDTPDGVADQPVTGTESAPAREPTVTELTE